MKLEYKLILLAVISTGLMSAVEAKFQNLAELLNLYS
jgi:hypothetical protein